MYDRPLALNDFQLGIAGLHHHFLNRPAGVIHPDGIKRYAFSADQDADLPSGKKVGPNPLIQRRFPDLEPGGHLAHGHICPHQQRTAILKSGRPGPGDAEILRLLTDIPDPLPRGKLRITRAQMLMQPINDTHAG